MVIIGGSGTGKSVILKHIIGLLRPDQGRVLVDEKDLSILTERSIDEIRKKFGMLFQGAALFDSLPVWENVGFALQQQTHLKDSEIKEAADSKLALVGLRGVGDLNLLNAFNAEGGAEGVGAATTGAVVYSSMLILISDYFLTAMLF